ncbi:MAG: lysophospholipid acyltransferase (LPLAT)-like uncharacterized protein [Chlamydiales bacterium]|jgi:lysophospholipid acyltransferase (LPLAT)-like uncharacterized protein
MSNSARKKRIPPPTDQPWRRRMRIARRAVGKAALGSFGPRAMKLLAGSWRYTVEGQELRDEAQRDSAVVLALWHGRMLLALPVSAGEDVSVLVSPSDDGDLSKQVLASFGYKVIRGSSNFGAPRAMRRMLEALDGGSAVTITPDGPRGPRHGITPGVAWIASATGMPVVPVGLVCDRSWNLRSWDHFTIPKPRARVVVTYGEAVRVEQDADADTLAQATETIRERMMRAELHGFELLGVPCDHQAGRKKS